MSVKANESTKQIVGSLWTGIANMRVIAINPTMDQLKAMGKNPQKEPEYKSTDTTTGNGKFRIDLHIFNVANKINGKASFWLEDAPRANKNKTGFEWINKFGVTAWGKGEAEPAYEWFKLEGHRKAFIGESDLISFIKAWANVDSKDACGLDTIDKIVKGDLTELLAIYKAIPNNEAKFLLGVKTTGEGKSYQDVYTKYFGRYTQVGFDAWKKALEKEYGEFKSDYQNDLHLRPFEGNAQVVADLPTQFGSPGSATPAQAVYKF